MQLKGNARVEAIASFKAAGRLLGLFTENPVQWFKLKLLDSLSADDIEQLIMQHNKARKGHDFVTADHIREKLATHNVVLEDSKGETNWRRK